MVFADQSKLLLGKNTSQREVAMPVSGHKRPEDLAQAVANELKKRRHQALPMAVLNELFNTLYFASLRTEESQPIACYIVYIDPNNPDPAPPKRIVKDRWSYVPLSEIIPF